MKRARLALTAVLWVLLGACAPPPPPTATPAPLATSTLPLPAPTEPPSPPLPTPTAAKLPPPPSPVAATPAPPPAGPLPRLLDQVDLSLPAGNAYEPHHLALEATKGLVYAVAARCPGALHGCIAQGNVETGILQRVVPLPGPAYGPIAALGPWVFLSYTDGAFQPHLASWDVENNRRVVDLALEGASPEILGVDPETGSLFVWRGTVLEARSTFDLQVLARAEFPQAGWQVSFQADPAAGRAYLATRDAVHGLEAGDLALLWTFQDPAWGEFGDLLLSADGTRLYVQAGQGLLALDPASGTALGQVPWRPEGVPPWQWSLVAADPSGDWLCLHRRDAPLPSLDWVRASTGELGARLPLWEGEEEFLYEGRTSRLLALRRENHEVALFQVGTKGLAWERAIATGLEVDALLLDARSSRVYATDTHGQLHVFQADASWEHLDEVAVLEGRGLLYLDGEHNRLYVSEDPGPVTLIYDTESLTLLQRVEVGGAIALDPAHDRWFLGHEVLDLADEALAPAVRVFAWEGDGASVREVARIPQPGLPAYNPLRDELYIVDDTAYVVDTATWQVTGELLPEFANPGFRRCNGCRIVSDVTVLPERDLLLVHVWPISAGKGAGLYPNPTVLRASTLAPLTPALTILTSVCGSTLGSMPGGRGKRFVAVADPVGRKTYENRTFSRYVGYQNVWVYEDGRPLEWLDGLAFALVDPVYHHALAPVGDRFLVLDLEAMAPLGEIPRACLRAVDFARGRFVATDGAEVRLYSLAGAEAPTPPPPREERPLAGLTALYPSPAFGRDGTLFAVGQGRVYRSRDGGATWERLRGGLPEGLEGGDLSVFLALSPAFGEDGTLFAAFREGDWLGLGVYRSADGGDTWHPAWTGLRSLRVDRLVVSPRFPEDQRVAAYARYQRLGDPFEGGEVLYLSTDGGRSWAEVGRHPEGVEGATALPDLATLLPQRVPRFPFRVGLGARTVERSADGGATWRPVLAVPEPLGWVQSLAVSPDLETDPSLFAFTSRAVLGSADAGETWQVAGEVLLAERMGEAWSSVATYVPAGNGGPLLLVALGDGSVLRLDPWSLQWNPLPTTTATPTPLLLPTGTPTPCAVSVTRFASTYARHQEALGCALDAEHTTWAAWQPFERGAMLWLEETREIWVLEDDGHWERFSDTWTEDQPASDPGLVPPQGLFQPVRGFGKVWREILGGPAAAVGWAVAPEEGRQALWQPFQGGWIFQPEGIRPLVVFAEGRWSQE